MKDDVVDVNAVDNSIRAPLASPDKGGVNAATAVLILLGWAILVRVALLVFIHVVTHGREINDDYELYEAMIRRPLMLVTGLGMEELGDGGVYAPLVPLHLWFPASLWSLWTGPVLGRRLGMLAYDLAAIAIALRVAFAVAGPPKTRAQWLAAALLAILPASLGASVVWGQEDTATAMWSALSLACYIWVGPLAGMAVAGAGLFTSKMFFVVLMLGVWLATPAAQRRRAALIGAAWVAAFGVFLLVRWRVSGHLYPDYHYHAMSNTPSIWAAYYLLIEPLKYDYSIRFAIKVAVVVAMLTFLAFAWPKRGRLPVWATVVGAHAAFFAGFIGIHPEHYQWFLPFLIVFAWDALLRGRRFAFGLALGITYLAYAYKIVYGLRGPIGSTADAKQVIRDAFERVAGFDLYWVQLTLVFVMLGSLVLMVIQSLNSPSPEVDRQSPMPSTPAST